MSLKWNVTKTEMLQKTEMGPKLQYDQKRTVTRTEIPPKRKCHQIWTII